MSNLGQLNESLSQTPNPFKKSIVKNAWDEIEDLEGINKNISEFIVKTINEIRETKDSKMILIQGEPGLGKTHLIVRLRRLAQRENYIFVNVRPLSDIKNLYRYILQEIMNSLIRPEENQPYSSLELMTANIIVKILKQLIKREGATPNPKILENINLLEKNLNAIYQFIQNNENIINSAKLFLKKEYPDMYIPFLDVLFQVPIKEKTLLALKWLSGTELLEEDLSLLHISNSIEDDNASIEVMKSIFRLLHKPILLTFDQLEAVEDRYGDLGGIKLLFEALTTIHDNFDNLCILIMCQSHIWNPTIKGKISEAALDRIDETSHLSKLSEIDATNLIKLRLEPIYRRYNISPPYATYPFPESLIIQTAKDTGWNPRKILNQFKSMFEVFQKNKTEFKETLDEEEFKEEVPKAPEVKTIDVIKFLKEKKKEFEIEYENDPSSYPYNLRQEFIKAVILDIFKGLNTKKIKIFNCEITKAQTIQSRAKVVDFIVQFKVSDKLIDVGFESNNTENNTSLYHAVKRLSDGLKGKFNRAFLIRDAMLRISPTASKTQELLKDLVPHNGVLYIDTDSTKSLIALKSLLDKSSSEDLTVESHIVSRDETMNFILEECIKQNGFVCDIFQRLNPMEKKDHENFNSLDQMVSYEGSLSQQTIEDEITDLLKSHSIYTLNKLKEILSIKFEISLEKLKSIITILNRNNKLRIMDVGLDLMVCKAV